MHIITLYIVNNFHIVFEFRERNGDTKPKNVKLIINV